ncbi:MAG: hypothetical protein WAN11_24285 [Syntrophobacteraceae bacterium]
MRFGWFPEQHTYESGTIGIQMLPEYEDSLRAIRESRYVHDDWFCVPIQSKDGSSGELRPPIPLPWFSLPATHLIEYKNEEAPTELLEFMITAFGWSQGLRFSPEGWGHFYKVALKPGMLTDFILLEQDVPRFLDLAERFWHQHQADGMASMMFGAIHWFLFSQSYVQYFERFMMQYIVLDTIYKVCASISGQKCRSHAGRVEYLANSLSVPSPSWGRIDSSGSEISRLRNALFHEARFGGVPIGFEFPTVQDNILAQLQAFNSRLIAALLGVTGSYSRSSSQTRQRFRFGID